MADPTPLHAATAAAGATFTEEAGFLIPAHFGAAEAEYHAARTGTIVADESHHGKVEVRGVDAPRFLHNLLTNDILSLQPGHGCATFLTTVKAKVIAYLLIYRDAAAEGPPSFSLDLAPGAAERVVSHLDRYLISEQVEFTNATRDFAQMHLAGAQSTAVLGPLVGDASVPGEPLRHGAVRFAGSVDGWARRHDALGVPGYDLICPSAQAALVWQRLTEAGARPAGREACEVLRIESGLPREGVDIDESTFAPEVGRGPEAICYTKGCYLGQESIVMARDRGQVNRTLVGVRLPGGVVPRGSPLFAQGKEVGRVMSSVRSPRLRGDALGLAYVRRGHQEPGTALEVEVNGQRAAAEVISFESMISD